MSVWLTDIRLRLVERNRMKRKERVRGGKGVELTYARLQDVRYGDHERTHAFRMYGTVTMNVRYAFRMFGTVTMNVRYPFRMYGTVTMKSVCQMQRPIRGKMPVMRVREGKRKREKERIE